MRNRIEKWYDELIAEELSPREIATCIGNGGIETPELMSVSESTDHIKIWDNEDGGSAQMGFITLSY